MVADNSQLVNILNKSADNGQGELELTDWVLPAEIGSAIDLAFSSGGQNRRGAFLIPYPISTFFAGTSSDGLWALRGSQFKGSVFLAVRKIRSELKGVWSPLRT